MGTIFCKNYKVVKLLGSGAFGEIYSCLNKNTNEELAIKLEKANTQHPQLFFEAKLYQYLQNDHPSQDKGIPKIISSTTEGDYNVMIMEQLGPSLEDLF